jgi:hypothetical protein
VGIRITGRLRKPPFRTTDAWTGVEIEIRSWQLPPRNDDRPPAAAKAPVASERPSGCALPAAGVPGGPAWVPLPLVRRARRTRAAFERLDTVALNPGHPPVYGTIERMSSGPRLKL